MDIILINSAPTENDFKSSFNTRTNQTPIHPIHDGKSAKVASFLFENSFLKRDFQFYSASDFAAEETAKKINFYCTSLYSISGSIIKDENLDELDWSSIDNNLISQTLSDKKLLKSLKSYENIESPDSAILRFKHFLDIHKDEDKIICMSHPQYMKTLLYDCLGISFSIEDVNQVYINNFSILYIKYNKETDSLKLYSLFQI